MRSHVPRWVGVAAGAWIVSAWVALVAGQGRGSAQERDGWADNLPPGQGQELALEQCSSCHTLEPVVQLRQSPDEWEGTVYDMIGRGAPIFLDEAKEIITYFSEVFGPDSPPFTDVNRASRDELVKVPGITADLADQWLAYRSANGPLTSRDELREIWGLEEKVFESFRYYLYAAPPAAPGPSTAGL